MPIYSTKAGSFTGAAKAPDRTKATGAALTTFGAALQAAQASQETQEGRAGDLARRARVPSNPGGRGYLPRPRGRLASGQCRPREPRPVEGHVGHRALPHGGTRRPRGSMHGLRPHPDRLQLVPQPPPTTTMGPKCQGAAAKDWLEARALIALGCSRHGLQPARF